MIRPWGESTRHDASGYTPQALVLERRTWLLTCDRFLDERLAAHATQRGRLGAQALEGNIGAAVGAVTVLALAQHVQRARSRGLLDVLIQHVFDLGPFFARECHSVLPRGIDVKVNRCAASF